MPVRMPDVCHVRVNAVRYVVVFTHSTTRAARYGDLMPTTGYARDSASKGAEREAGVSIALQRRGRRPAS